jgi:uncharacterized protein (TIGR02453 family)
MLDELIKEPFLGFPKKALKFLKDLSIPSNNNKAWFDENRNSYEENLKKPMRDLIDTLAIEINKIDPDIVVNYKSIFRINRDVRFAKDKRPYKEIYAAAFAFDRIKAAEIPAFYFHFNAKEFLFASGQYSMDNDYLKKIRNHIFKNYNNYKAIITEKKFVKTFGNVSGESLIKLPKGYEGLNIEKEDPALIEILKMKQFYVYNNFKPDIVLKDDLPDVISEHIKISYDFNKFLSNAIK